MKGLFLKIFAGICAVILVIALNLFLFKKISFPLFLITAIVIGFIAYYLIPWLKGFEGG